VLLQQPSRCSHAEQAAAVARWFAGAACQPGDGAGAQHAQVQASASGPAAATVRCWHAVSSAQRQEKAGQAAFDALRTRLSDAGATTQCVPVLGLSASGGSSVQQQAVDQQVHLWAVVEVFCCC
jgi:hypothetical protein